MLLNRTEPIICNTKINTFKPIIFLAYRILTNLIMLKGSVGAYRCNTDKYDKKIFNQKRSILEV